MSDPFRRNSIICFLFLISSFAHSQSNGLAIRGGQIHTVSGDVIPNGTVLIAEGKIQAVGANISIPAGTHVIDARGLIVTPGIIDARCNYGVRVSMDRRTLMTPSRRIVDNFRPQHDSDWLRGGVTTAYVALGPQKLLGGFGAVVKLAGDSAGAIVKETESMHASFGESALRRTLRAPTTRQGMIGRLRQEFVRTQEYMAARRGDKKEIDPDLEAIAEVLRREAQLRVYANTPDDIMTALRVAKEFNIKLIIESGAGAHIVADAVAKAGVPVVVGPSIMGIGGGGPYELFAHTPENAGRLHKAGVKIALCTNSGGNHSVLLEGVVAKSHGLPEEAALRAVTLIAAEILGVADQLGSIEPGRDADIVVWKNHPLSTWGESQVVIVDGRIVFERN